MITSLFSKSTNLLRPSQRVYYLSQYQVRDFGLFDRFFRAKKKVEKVEKKEQEEKQDDNTIEIDPIEQREQELDEFINIEKQQQEEAEQIEAQQFEEKVSSRDQNINNLQPLGDILAHQGGSKKEVRSFIDKLNDITINEDGTIKHNICIKSRKARTFKNMQQFYKWRGEILRVRRASYKQHLTPHQYYVTQGKGYERPFTGEHWWTKDVGIYHCVVCSQRLFMSDHKFESRSGYPTFWNHIVDALKFQTDNLELPKYTQAYQDPLLRNKEPLRRVTCSNCDSHLGHIFNDGPAPFGKRFQINSASLDFQPKPWFTIPKYPDHIMEQIQRTQAQARKGIKDYKELLEHEKLLNIVSWKDEEAKKKIKAQKRKQKVFDIKGVPKKTHGQKPIAEPAKEDEKQEAKD